MAHTSLGNANTPTGLSTPDLLAWIKANVNASGNSFVDSFVAPLLGQAGTPTMATIRKQLSGAGYKPQQVNQILNTGPGTFQHILDQIGQSAVLLPGEGAAGAGAGAGEAGAGAGDAAAGAGAGAGAGDAAAAGAGAGLGTAATAATSALAIAGIWSWLTTASHWLRILEFVGGAVLVYLAVKGLTGIDTPNITAAAGKVAK